MFTFIWSVLTWGHRVSGLVEFKEGGLLLANGKLSCSVEIMFTFPSLPFKTKNFQFVSYMTKMYVYAMPRQALCRLCIVHAAMRSKQKKLVFNVWADNNHMKNQFPAHILILKLMFFYQFFPG